jgi:2-polyprenyl-3-methyl-5-hydroxy-6-metoxy-1,4-benzoquinol methylase
MISQTDKDIRNIIDLVDIENKSILELGCGSGRITFALADRVLEIMAIDIDAKAIESARQRNLFDNVTFLVENLEDFNLEKKFELILSLGVGYMYLRDLPNAIKTISLHLEKEGIFLAICSSPEDEYQKIVSLLVEENVKTISFYSEFDELLSNYFTFEKTMLKGQLTFSHFEDIVTCFQRELKEEYQKELKNPQIQQLKGYFEGKTELSIGDDSQAYICKSL